MTPDDLAYADLSKYTTIVTGIRAYQTRKDLKASNNRLLKYAEAGGNLVIQYNKFEFNQLAAPSLGEGGFPSGRPRETDSPFAPYPAAVTTNRITVEETPLKVLVPTHALLTTPNAIGAADWDGWVQERGLYFLNAKDARYVDLLAATDPWPNNPGEKKGMLTTATVGKGTWTYVALGLFRQVVDASTLSEGFHYITARAYRHRDPITDGGPAVFTDFRRVLERKDVDVVVNGTPDHWHTLVNLAAAAAKKDIYAEKPLTSR